MEFPKFPDDAMPGLDGDGGGDEGEADTSVDAVPIGDLELEDSNQGEGADDSVEGMGGPADEVCEPVEGNALAPEGPVAPEGPIAHEKPLDPSCVETLALECCGPENLDATVPLPSSTRVGAGPDPSEYATSEEYIQARILFLQYHFCI